MTLHDPSSFTTRAVLLVATLLPLPVHAEGPAQLVRDFYAAVDAEVPDPAVYGALLAEGFVDQDRPAAFPADMPDRDVTLGLLAELERGFPDATHSLDILEPVGTDRAVVYWTFRGRHDGPFFGVPASGRQVEINGVDIFRVVDGRFVEQWHVEELQALFAQIAGES